MTAIDGRAPLLLDDLFAGRARQPRPTDDWGNEDENAISLSYGFADPDHFPRRALHEASGEVLYEDGAEALNYGPTYPGLTRFVAQRLAARGVTAGPGQILITHGSSQALGLLPQILVEPGDTVLIEGPSFMGAVKYFLAARANLVTIPIDEHGIDVDHLEQTLRDLRATNIRPKFLYTIPTFQNPTGTLLPLERRKKLVALAAEYGVVVIEDDAYGDLQFEGEALPKLAALDEEGWVVHVATFSKILAPGIRFGYAYGRPEIIQRMQLFKIEGGNGPYMSRVVERFCADGKLDAHIAELVALYRRKRDLMLDTIAREFPSDVIVPKPAGGFFVWPTLPQGMSATALLKRAAAHGVAFVPGGDFYANGQGDNHIRLAFSFQNEAHIVEGIRRVGTAMRELETGA